LKAPDYRWLHRAASAWATRTAGAARAWAARTTAPAGLPCDVATPGSRRAVVSGHDQLRN